MPLPPSPAGQVFAAWPLPPVLPWLLSLTPPSTTSPPLLATADIWSAMPSTPHQQLRPTTCSRTDVAGAICNGGYAGACVCRQHLRFQRLSGQHLNNSRHLHTQPKTASQQGLNLCRQCKKILHQKYYHYCWFCHFQ